jgi:fused signal recognition particle receptor
MEIVIALVVLAVIVVAFVAMRRGGAKELPPETGKKLPEEKRAEAKPAGARTEGAEPAAERKAPAKKAEPEVAKAAEKAKEAEPAKKEPEAKPAPRGAERAAHGPSEEDIAALKKGLKNTRGGFIARLAKLFGQKKEIDPELLNEIEEVLLTADIGVKTAEKILGRLRDRLEKKELADADRVWEALREEALAILGGSPGGVSVQKRPTVILVVGVNGVGKTTTIGKLASRFKDEGKKVVLAAGDTFRAAAVLQLEVWGRRTDCAVVKGKERADPASVIFDAVKKAKEDGADVVIADTAGRLHTKAPLMEEIKKVHRIVEKALDGRPADEVLLVLDSTNGQNAIQQAQMFREAVPVTGIALTKLDGTAKGGVIAAIARTRPIPVRFIGVGEGIEDLRPFSAREFVDALFE